MNDPRKNVWLYVQVLVVAAILFLAAPSLLAQSSSSSSSGSSSSSSCSSSSSSTCPNPATNFNVPPCDFADSFYNNNGISTSSQGDTTETAMGVDSPPAQRFGLFRQTGPPAIFPGQVNWKIDPTTCSRDAVRNNVRILATTGGYIDSDGSPTDFISIIAFVVNQNFFESSFVSGDPAFDCSVPPMGTLPTSGCVVITPQPGNLPEIQPNGTQPGQGEPNDLPFVTEAGLNARNTSNLFYNPGINGDTGVQQGSDMQDIVSNFEAYAALRQIVNGVRTFTPCGNLAGNGNITTNCFPITSVATPQLSQDWRFATNRNAVDGSDGNNVAGAGSSGATVFNSPYGYFCDDVLGMWIITYFWFTEAPNLSGTPPVGDQCQGPNGAYATLAAKNGLNLEGWPIVKSGPADLNQGLEAFFQADGVTPCAVEGREDVGGSDGGAVWLVCPAIPDPTNGAITLDAFLDQVHKPNGAPLDPNFTINFFCLQFFGQFCSNLTSAQVSSAQSQGASAAAAAAAAASTN